MGFVICDLSALSWEASWVSRVLARTVYPGVHQLVGCGSVLPSRQLLLQPLLTFNNPTATGSFRLGSSKFGFSVSCVDRPLSGKWWEGLWPQPEKQQMCLFSKQRREGLVLPFSGSRTAQRGLSAGSLAPAPGKGCVRVVVRRLVLTGQWLCTRCAFTDSEALAWSAG